MNNSPQATGYYLKSSFPATSPTDFSVFNPGTMVQNASSPFEAYLVGETGSKPLVLSSQVPITSPTTSGVFIRRNGLLPILGPGSTDKKLRLTFVTAIATSGGLSAGRASVNFTVGGNGTTPDVTGATPTNGETTAILGAADLSGAAAPVVGVIVSDKVTGLVDIEFTFTATNSKRVTLELFGEQFILNELPV